MATTTRLKMMDDRMDQKEQIIQHVQGEVAHMREYFQVIFAQVNDLSFKFSMLMAELQQKRCQSSALSVVQNRGDQENVRGQHAVNMKPM